MKVTHTPTRLLTLLSLLLVGTCVAASGQTTVKKGPLKSLKGLTKVYVGEMSGSTTVADHLKANTEGLVFVDNWKDADFSIHVSPGQEFADGFNSAPRSTPTNAIVADIEGPINRHPSDSTSTSAGRSVGISVTRFDGAERINVWMKSRFIPVARTNMPAHSRNALDPNLVVSMERTALALVDDFLKSYKKI